jgi:uncharacterized MAPEG superfamily protein
MFVRRLPFVFQFCVLVALTALYVCIAQAQPLADTNRKFTPEQLIEDVDFYVKTLEEAHVNPYATVSAAKFRAHAENIKSKIRQHGAMTQKEFWRLFAPLVASVGDSHTIVMETRFFTKAEDDPTKYLPVHADYIDGKVVVTDSFADEKIEKGAMITAVNEVAAKELVRRLGDYQSGTEREKTNRAAGWLWIGAAEVFGRPDEFTLSLAGGKKVTVKGMKLPELLKRMQAASKLKTTAATAASSNSPIELKFLDAETAYLNALTFEYDLEKYKTHLKDVFMQIKSAGVRNLIIDVRNNRGGNSALGDALIDMFNAKPLRGWASKWKRSVFYAEALKRGESPLPESSIKKYLAARPGETLSSDFGTVTPGANPLRFGGQVYVLSGAKTFSSGVMFLGDVKDNKLAKIVGEETDEPACMFGEMSMFWLPHSRLRMSLSVKSWTPPSGVCNGTRGIVPDVVVKNPSPIT